MNLGRIGSQGFQYQTQGVDVIKICFNQMRKKIMEKASRADWINSCFKKDVMNKQKLNMQ